MKDTKNLEYRKVQGLVVDQSFSIVLPKSYAVALGIGKVDFVKVHQEDGSIVIEKTKGVKKKDSKNSNDKLAFKYLILRRTSVCKGHTVEYSTQDNDCDGVYVNTITERPRLVCSCSCHNNQGARIRPV